MSYMFPTISRMSLIVVGYFFVIFSGFGRYPLRLALNFYFILLCYRDKVEIQNFCFDSILNQYLSQKFKRIKINEFIYYINILIFSIHE